MPFINEIYITLDKSFVIKMTDFERIAIKNNNEKYTGKIKNLNI